MAPGYKRSTGGCREHHLATGVQAIQPSPYRAGLAEPTLQRFGAVAALPTCCCPSWLSPQGRSVGPKISSESLPTESGILCRVTRRTAALGFLVEGADALPDPALAPRCNPGGLHRVAQGVAGLEFRDVHRGVGYATMPHLPFARGLRPRSLRRETGLPGGQRIPSTAATVRRPAVFVLGNQDRRPASGRGCRAFRPPSSEPAAGDVQPLGVEPAELSFRGAGEVNLRPAPPSAPSGSPDCRSRRASWTVRARLGEGSGCFGASRNRAKPAAGPPVPPNRVPVGSGGFQGNRRHGVPSLAVSCG